ncbi:helix-turn-helix domain-containing protein [Halalkalibacter flavus]|jgi:transcriptional regulator with XRE-family HTH domain|uniref:helix-turn-helix domain-containing protein n=1 Tax=Halalkalibacter flavus TaxID=3090668 RepID=UPI002FCA3DD0
MPDFKTRLKRLRKQNNLTQQEVGDKIQVSKVAVSGYENGIRTPEISTLKKIADLFETTIDYLVGYSDIPEKSSDYINPTTTHYLSDIGILEGKYKIIIDDKEVDEELIKEAIDYIRAKRIMKKLSS